MIVSRNQNPERSWALLLSLPHAPTVPMRPEIRVQGLEDVIWSATACLDLFVLFYLGTRVYSKDSTDKIHKVELDLQIATQIDLENIMLREEGKLKKDLNINITLKSTTSVYGSK